MKFAGELRSNNIGSHLFARWRWHHNLQAVEDDGLADAALVVGDALVQLPARHPVPVLRGQQLVECDLLQVEQQRAGVRAPAPLTRLGQLVAGGAPAGGQCTIQQ